MSRGAEACRARVRRLQIRARCGPWTERLGLRRKVTRRPWQFHFRGRPDCARSPSPLARRRYLMILWVIPLFRCRCRWGRGCGFRPHLCLRRRRAIVCARSPSPLARRRHLMILWVNPLFRCCCRWGRCCGFRPHLCPRLRRAIAARAALKFARALVEACQVVNCPAGGASPITLGRTCAEIHTQASEVERIRAEVAHQQRVPLDANLATGWAIIEPLAHLV